MTVPSEGAILPVDKPEGPTSHDLVGRARRALGIRRIGHTGTLDPFASGLMLLCVGPATRLSQYLTGERKEYRARARLGVRTETLDPEGEVVAESDGWKGLDRERVESALAAFRGKIQQLPPRFSAKKVGGQPAHRRVRRGEEVALDPVPVTIHELELEECSLPEVVFRVVCSAGTYIRALARDLGEALEVGAYLTELRRTRIGNHQVEEAVSGDFRLPVPDHAWITPLQALAAWEQVEVSLEHARRLAQGQRVRVQAPESPKPGPQGHVAVHLQGRLLAVARIRDGVVRPEKVFPQVLETAS